MNPKIIKPAISPILLKLKTDSALDSEFAAEHDRGVEYRFSAYYTQMLNEIGGRIASPSGFLMGLVSGSRFPEYEKRFSTALGGFSQGETAKQAVSDSAKNVADTAIGFAKLGGALIVIGAAAFIYWKAKKK